MNENQVVFDEAIKCFGGICVENDNRGLVKTKEYLLKFISRIRNENQTIPEINLEFVNNNNINAFAFVHKEKYYIGIFKGTIDKLKQIFNKICDSNEFYENPNFDIKNKEIYKEKLYEYSILFLVTHELCHIRYGHCDYSKVKGNKFMREFSEGITEEEGMESQTIEMDADCCAIATIVNRLIVDSTGDNKEDKCRNAEEEISYLMFSTYYLFRVLSENKNIKDYTLKELRCSTHPYAGIRQNYLCANVSTLYVNILGNDNKIVSNIVDCIVNMSILAEKIYSNRIDKYMMPMLIGFTDIGAQHLKDILNNWENVKPLLENYTHDGLTDFEYFDSKTVLL